MDYFKPLRRKLGVVTLLMACGFMAGWMRSEVRCDYIDTSYDIDRVNTHEDFRTIHGTLQLTIEKRTGTFGIDSTKWGSFVLSDGEPARLQFDRPEDLSREWRVDWLGFRFGNETSISSAMQVTTYAIPYWSIVAPLILLSAYLLLSKPRAKSGPTQS